MECSCCLSVCSAPAVRPHCHYTALPFTAAEIVCICSRGTQVVEVQRERERSLQRISLIEDAVVPLRSEREKLRLLMDGLALEPA